jgi:hypothetical protein
VAVNVIKAERVVRTMLGVLERDSVLARMMWRNPAGDFRGAKGDAITIKVPAYTNANKRDLRSGTPRTKSNLTERRVIVTLDTDLYKVIPITDEELTLDIESFEEQIVAPVASSLVRGIEDEALALAEGATYQHTVNFDDFSAPFDAIARARRLLNDSRVPMAGRVLVVGSAVEELLLTDPQFVRVDQSGSTEALREAQIGRVAGTPVFTVPGLEPGTAFMFHQTAYALSYRAPFVPRGAPWGATMAWEGFALRVVQAIDPDEVVDNFHADVWTGTNVVRDYGTIDGNGFFVPSENPDLDNDIPLFVRAVKLTGGS